MQVEFEISGEAERVRAAEQTALFYTYILLLYVLIYLMTFSNSEYILMASNNRMKVNNELERMYTSHIDGEA